MPAEGTQAAARVPLNRLRCNLAPRQVTRCAVPLMVGVLLVDVLPALGPVTTGWVGAVVSIVNVVGAEAGLVLPTASTAVAVSVWLPSLNGVLGVQFQLPNASAVAVQRTVVPSITVTVLLGSAVPLSAGLLTMPVAPLAEPVPAESASACQEVRAWIPLTPVALEGTFALFES